jgi:hypothetical protein
MTIQTKSSMNFMLQIPDYGSFRILFIPFIMCGIYNEGFFFDLWDIGVTKQG